MGEPILARTDRPLTPAQAVYDALANAGYVHKKSDFSSIVEMNQSNVYSYLGDPDRGNGFLVASIEKLHAWANEISQKTDIRIEIRLLYNGSLNILAEGKSKNGSPFGPMLYPTVYNEYPWGFKPVRKRDESV